MHHQKNKVHVHIKHNVPLKAKEIVRKIPDIKKSHVFFPLAWRRTQVVPNVFSFNCD